MSSQTFSPQEALHLDRQLGIRVRLDQSILNLKEEDIAVLFDVLVRHGVFCLVDQPPIAPSQLHDIVARWGDIIELPPGLALANQEPRFPSITRVGNIRPDGSIIPDVTFAEYWHHDGDFWPPGQNFVVSFLSTVKVPSTGGRTGYLDTQLAFQLLEASLRDELAGAYICVRASEIPDFKHASPEEIPPDVQHPVLLSHPAMDQTVLYLPDSTSGIQKKNGEFLMTVENLVEALKSKLPVFEHAWSEGDLLITDNLQVMHRSMGGYGNHPRLLYRCQARIVKD
jgi:taurine dioxygenase